MTASKRPQRARKPRAKAPRPSAARPAGPSLHAVWAHRGAIAAALAAIIVCLGAFGLRRYLATPNPGAGRTLRLTLAPDATARGITRTLWDAHAITRPWLFEALLWVSDGDRRAARGVIALRDDLSPWAVLRALRSGRRGLIRVTLPEGFTRFDIARRLEANGVCAAEAFLRATESQALLRRYGVIPDSGSLEGYLYPDTYDLAPESDPEALIERMVSQFERRVDALSRRHPDALPRASERVPAAWRSAMPAAGRISLEVQLVTHLAALVERETAHPDDRQQVAAVFWNRLTDPRFVPRLLQSDPTLRYGCLVRQRRGEDLGPCADPSGALRRVPNAAMLGDARNAWNTYRHELLPPSPIANPGLASLEAAFSPSSSSDLYFVAGRDRRSVFARTLEEHRQNVTVIRAQATRDAGPADAVP